MRRLMFGGLLIAVLGLVSASRAQADGVDTFTYTFDGNTFVWQLPSSPTIGAGDFVLGGNFAILDVPYSENGVAQTHPNLTSFLLLVLKAEGSRSSRPVLRLLQIRLAHNYIAVWRMPQRLYQPPTT